MCIGREVPTLIGKLFYFNFHGYSNYLSWYVNIYRLYTIIIIYY